ncbi:hypothetical protein [Curtobacterium sp. NPDC086286]|uniref:hypothetical protein n=1 Tax=Curtobacterium sp. NPDC086286 TaxID=3363964 RepID=UPI00380583FF
MTPDHDPADHDRLDHDRPDHDRPDHDLIVHDGTELLAAAIGTVPDPGELAAALESTVRGLPDSAIVDVLRAVRPRTAAWLRAHGASADQAADSIADVDRKLARYGLRGTGLDWFCAVLTARVVTVGRLQFEIGDTTADGSAAWGVHVPETGPLDAPACDRSFDEAPAILRAVAPSHVAGWWQCRSWILDPGLPDVLGPDANLVRFARRFELGPPSSGDAAEGDGGVAKFVLGTTLPDARAAVSRGSIPSGRLAAWVAARWRSGEHWTARTGTIRVADPGRPPGARSSGAARPGASTPGVPSHP